MILTLSCCTCVLEGPPAAPTGVMTTVDESRFTASTASITLTWSASSGADNYTIMVTPPLPSGQSLLSTTTTSLQLMVLYNEEYSLNITAHNHCGTNNTFVISSPIGNLSPMLYSINNHSNLLIHSWLQSSFSTC